MIINFIFYKNGNKDEDRQVCRIGCRMLQHYKNTTEDLGLSSHCNELFIGAAASQWSYNNHLWLL